MKMFEFEFSYGFVEFVVAKTLEEAKDFLCEYRDDPNYVVGAKIDEIESIDGETDFTVDDKPFSEWAAEQKEPVYMGDSQRKY